MAIGDDFDRTANDSSQMIHSRFISNDTTRPVNAISMFAMPPEHPTEFINLMTSNDCLFERTLRRVSDAHKSKELTLAFSLKVSGYAKIWLI